MRRHLALIAVFATVPFAAHADDLDIDCTTASATIELTLCADRTQREADARLNKAYKNGLSRLDKEAASRLRAAQRAWIAFRDAECAYRNYENRGGSGENIGLLECLTGLTNERTKQLQEGQN